MVEAAGVEPAYKMRMKLYIKLAFIPLNFQMF